MRGMRWVALLSLILGVLAWRRLSRTRYVETNA